MSGCTSAVRPRGVGPRGWWRTTWSWRPNRPLRPGINVVAGDVDGDGDADLGVSGSLSYDFVAGHGDGGFAAPVNVIQLPAGPGFDDLGTGDVDGDGVAEVLAVSSEFGAPVVGHVVALRDGVSSIASFAEEGTAFLLVTAADIDGDGLDDLAVERFTSPFSQGRVRLLRSTGAGFTGFGEGGALTSLPTSAALADIELRDIDGDGSVDFLTSDGTELSWWHGVGNGTFAFRVDRPAGPAPAASRGATSMPAGGPTSWSPTAPRPSPRSPTSPTPRSSRTTSPVPRSARSAGAGGSRWRAHAPTSVV